MKVNRATAMLRRPSWASAAKRFAPIPIPKRKVVNVIVESYEKRAAWNAQMLSAAADMIGIRRTGPLIMPSKHQEWNIPSSPFKHRTATEFLRKVTHRRILSIEGPPQIIDRFIKFAVETSDPCCGIRIQEKYYYNLESFLNYKGA